LKKGYVSFSFDDARGDFFDVYRIMKQRNMAFTLNVTTGYVDRTSSKMNWPCGKDPITLEQLKEIVDYKKSEISLHGNDHNNEIANVRLGNDKIKNWFPFISGEKLGFASCCSRLPIDEYLDNKWMNENTLYLRASFRIKSYSLIRVFSRKLWHIFPFTQLFTIAYGDTVMHNGDNPRIIYALPVTNEMTVKELLGLVKIAIKENGYLVFMMHSIMDDISNEDPWSYSTEKFVNLLEELDGLVKNNMIEIISCRDIHEIMNNCI